MDYMYIIEKKNDKKHLMKLKHFVDVCQKDNKITHVIPGELCWNPQLQEILQIKAKCTFQLSSKTRGFQQSMKNKSCIWG